MVDEYLEVSEEQLQKSKDERDFQTNLAVVGLVLFVLSLISFSIIGIFAIMFFIIGMALFIFFGAASEATSKDISAIQNALENNRRLDERDRIRYRERYEFRDMVDNAFVDWDQNTEKKV